MSVEIEIPIGEIEEEPESASKTYKLDLNTGRISGMIDGREAAEQAIRKALVLSLIHISEPTRPST